MNLSEAFQNIVNQFKQTVPAVDFWSLRLVIDQQESLSVRQNVVQPPYLAQSQGAHITLVRNGAAAYAATSQLNREGFKAAIDSALRWLRVSESKMLFNASDVPRPVTSGNYASKVAEAWTGTSLSDKITLLQDTNRHLKLHDSIVDWQAYLCNRETQVLLLTSDGIEIKQSFQFILPGMEAVANIGSETQQRTGGGWGSMRQGGLEQLDAVQFPTAATRVAEEAMALVNAPQCPTGCMSLLLMPSQMMLQIHESIGHPLELDRILGDERNYAGTSFVTLDMCGHYQYGSELLNVTYDPGQNAEMASFGYDDDGSHAERTFIIRNGILERFLGGAVSQARTGLAGVANARASDWNRPPIDRMANLNVEPGNHSLQDLIGGIENGVLMDTNLSWSIDDSRNKFQFGCELARIIKDGELQTLVRNPNYRGVSATFWRNLSAVGDASTFEIWGTPNCGKGEPNQMIHVGHASPACVFRDVQVFGGD
ncbi:MAG: TldD/PmbA family protein [Gammaproteobacteria bacterium]|jgi:predicted Zn-dependent protease|nr:TldD/PmbA family protein [Gammaproteobacteria bacterium]